MIQRAEIGVDQLTHPRARVSQWATVLVPPLAALGQETTNYILVAPSCLAGTELWLHLVSLAAFLVSISMVPIALGWWRRTGWRWPGESGGPPARTRLLGVLGAWSGIIFGLVIIAQWLAVVFLTPCLP